MVLLMFADGFGGGWTKEKILLIRKMLIEHMELIEEYF
jgi:hypothetical protein